MASIMGIFVVDIQLKHLKKLGSLFYLQSRCTRVILSPMGQILEEKVNNYALAYFESSDLYKRFFGMRNALKSLKIS